MSDISNQNDEDFRDPATRAFDALRDELARVRQSMEDLHAGIQQSRPHDYRKTLGEMQPSMAISMTHLTNRLDGSTS